VIPASREERFHTASDYQTQITIPIYQGEHALCRDNRKLGEVSIKVPKKPQGEEAVDVRFTYDLNGILEVDVMAVSTKKRESVVIEGAPGRLTRAQVEKARAEMQRLKLHPRDKLPNTTALARADALFVELVGHEREVLGHGIAALRAAIDTQDEQFIGEARERLNGLVSSLRGRR
jgi:molecular chaperone HscC